MPRTAPRLSPAHRIRTTLAATVCVTALAVPLVASQAAAAASDLPVSDEYYPSAAIGFHDYTRTGDERVVRNDLTGDLGAMVEFAQATTVAPTGNKAEERPNVVADRVALLLVTPTSPVSSLRVEVSANGAVLGTLDLARPNRLPAADQTFDARGTVAYSLKAWSAEIPSEWMRPGLTLKVVDGTGRTGLLQKVDVAAPKEMVINNIRLGMLTDAPAWENQRFITNPASGATDYFQTLPVAKLTVAQYETVELEKVIVASGAIYTVDSPDPSQGSVYSGTMRENVGKAQVSTGINLATWGITSSRMTQSQPQNTNQRVIHHSAGLYSNGAVAHGLSGGNGMATLYDSVGNELSHELGHSYGLGHYPGTDNGKTGDDRIRNASHHMDSGWGYIAHRGLMRSNLDTGGFAPERSINGYPFSENLAGRYNFNTDAMSGGWDASPVSDYTHHTAYSLTRIQNSLRSLVADTAYPSGYRDWDATAGAWVDAKVLNPQFALPKPAAVGVPVFTLLGGYNPAQPAQTVLYPAFRSNYGVTFDLPQANTSATSAQRVCWVRVDFDGKPSRSIALDASDGVKQLNVNIAEADRPTGAQVSCRQDGQTTDLGDAITIATDLKPMAAPVVVGQQAGFETLRAQELKALQPKLEALAGAAAPVLSEADTIILKGWADDLSGLSSKAEAVADRILQLVSDAADVEAYLAEHARAGKTAADLPALKSFLEERDYVDTDGSIVPAGRAVTVDNGRCLYRGAESLLVDSDAKTCADTRTDTWFADVAGRLHSAQNPDQCITAGTPAALRPCALNAGNQRWSIEADGHVVQLSNKNSAFDYYRGPGYPGMYSRSASSNQIWKSFVPNTNPLLAYLSASGLAAFVGNVTNVDKPEVPGVGADPDAGGPGGSGSVDPVDPDAVTPGGSDGAAPGNPDDAGPGGSVTAGDAGSSSASGGATGSAGGEQSLATTGAAIAWGTVGAALVMILAGASVLLFRRWRMA